MVKILKDLELDEISLVDVPANPLAIVPMYKRDKSMDETEKKEFEKKLADAMVEIEALKKQLSDKEEVEKRAKEEYVEIEGEKILKSAVPAPLLKRLETLEIEKADSALEKRAKELIPHFTGDVAKHKKLVKSIGDDKELEVLLVAADKLFADMMKEVGKSDGQDMKSTTEKMDELAKAKMAELNVNYPVAYAKMLETPEGKELYKQSLKEKK